MDNYTKMCDCHEIQSAFTMTSYGVHERPHSGQVVYVKPLGYTQIVLSAWKADTGIYLYFGQGHRNFTTGECIYLPTIEQLMGMVLTDRSDLNKCWNFTEFYVQYGTVTEFEPNGRELWLAFVMWELHGLRWNGKGWE